MPWGIPGFCKLSPFLLRRDSECPPLYHLQIQSRSHHFLKDASGVHTIIIRQVTWILLILAAILTSLLQPLHLLTTRPSDATPVAAQTAQWHPLLVQIKVLSGLQATVPANTIASWSSLPPSLPLNAPQSAWLLCLSAHGCVPQAPHHALPDLHSEDFPLPSPSA